MKLLQTTWLVLVGTMVWQISFAQNSSNKPFCGNQSVLDITQIMRGQDFTGSWVENIAWSADSRTVYFDWKQPSDEIVSRYQIAVDGATPKLADLNNPLTNTDNGVYNKARTLKAFVWEGNVYLYDVKSNQLQQVTRFAQAVESVMFSADEQKLIYEHNSNLFTISLQTSQIEQITDFRIGYDDSQKQPASQQDIWLQRQQNQMFDVLRQKQWKDSIKNTRKIQTNKPKVIYTNNMYVSNIRLSPDYQYVTYELSEQSSGVYTQYMDFVTKSGYAQPKNARPKVGTDDRYNQLWIYDIKKDTTYRVNENQIPNLDKLPDFVNEYKNIDKKLLARRTYMTKVIWSDDGTKAVVVVRASDNKDRWLMLLNPADGKLSQIYHHRDEAWIAGPGIGGYGIEDVIGWMPDNRRIWFQSEESGYSHLYVADVNSGSTTAITKGYFEVEQVQMSLDKKSWYLWANHPHPGELHLYKVPIEGGNMTQLTTGECQNETFLSPDQRWIAFRTSYSNKPWELYIVENKTGATPRKITKSTSDAFDAYSWRVPEFVTFNASDGATVHARLYRPAGQITDGRAVVFVHGAGYLQNAHKGWSTYFREYMFHNLLVDNGYTVLDIDYRGSAGYGRDWRTGIYRYMGGKDLNDHIDGVRFLIQNCNVSPQKIGIYGGSYGGFITLMAMFNSPGTFKCGAALRSVTDWAHYNHIYTSNILNLPITDSIAYYRSSPINFANGLQGHLLMLHGMVDDNVQFQDIIRLSQRFIELGKDNWELAVFPMEPHGFIYASSWADEYKRIFKLFQKQLNQSVSVD